MAEAIVPEVSGSGIYQIRNLLNGKTYIGSAKSFRVRWAKHLGDLRRGVHHSAYLQRSWIKYGAEAFIFEVIQVCEAAELVANEQRWMDEKKPEYNVSPMAGNCLGVKHSQATKDKHSARMKGVKASPETIAKRIGQKRTPEQRLRFSQAQKSRVISPEMKAKMAEAARIYHLGRKQSPEEIENRRRSMMGHVVTEETRAKLSVANKGRKPSALAIERSVAANKGKKRSEEFREKLRGRKHSEEWKAQMSARMKGRFISEETRKKISDGNKGKKLSQESIRKRQETRKANSLRKSAC
jgi:group I intron endonuclease